MDYILSEPRQSYSEQTITLFQAQQNRDNAPSHIVIEVKIFWIISMERLRFIVMVMTLLLSADKLLAAYTFQQSFRIEAGQPFLMSMLRLDSLVQLETIEIMMPDSESCVEYAFHRLDDNYRILLENDLVKCSADSACDHLVWYPNLLLEFRCLNDSQTSHATAITVRGRYTVPDEREFLATSGQIDTDQLRSSCPPGQEPQLDKALTVSEAVLVECHVMRQEELERQLASALHACRSPCKALKLNRESGWPCEYVIGMQQFANLTSTSTIAQLLLFHSCVPVNATASPPPANDQKPAKAEPPSVWVRIAAAFIILFALAAIGIIVILIVCARRGTQQTTASEAILRSKFNQPSQKHYASHTIVKRKQSLSPLPPPSHYVDACKMTRDSAATVSTYYNGDSARSSAAPENDYELYVEAEPAIFAEKRPPLDKSRLAAPQPQQPRVSALYMEFES